MTDLVGKSCVVQLQAPGSLEMPLGEGAEAQAEISNLANLIVLAVNSM